MKTSYISAILSRLSRTETRLDLVKILRSLEEFLFEVISWLVFFPRTLWRVVRAPLAMADYAVRELRDPEQKQFDDSISPPLFLILAVVLAHVVELQVGDLLPAAKNPLGQMLTESQTNLLIFRAIIFSLWSLLGALAYLHSRRETLNRQNLRPPFFALCLLTGPFAVAYSSAAALIYDPSLIHTAIGWAILLLAVVWYVTVMARWFRRTLEIGAFAAAGLAVGSFLIGTAISVVIGALLLGGSNAG